MTTPVFTLPTSGSDPRKATKEGLEENINQIIQYLDNSRISGDEALVTGSFYAGEWDPSVETQFPSQRLNIGGSVQNGDFFSIANSGFIDGVNFSRSTILRAYTDNPSTTTYLDNWKKSAISSEFPITLLRNPTIVSTGEATYTLDNDLPLGLVFIDGVQQNFSAFTHSQTDREITFAENVPVGAEIEVLYSAETTAYSLQTADNVSSLLSNTVRTYSNTEVGASFNTRKDGFSYVLMPATFDKPHIITAGGLRLNVVAGDTKKVSLLAFGAVGDGVTDNTTPFTRAAATGWKILIPEGIFYAANNISFTTDFGGFEGLAEPQIDFTNNSFSGGSIIKGLITASGLGGISLKNIGVDASDASLTEGISITDFTGVSVEGVTVIGSDENNHCCLLQNGVLLNVKNFKSVGGKQGLAAKAQFFTIDGVDSWDTTVYGFTFREDTSLGRDGVISNIRCRTNLRAKSGGFVLMNDDVDGAAMQNVFCSDILVEDCNTGIFLLNNLGNTTPMTRVSFRDVILRNIPAYAFQSFGHVENISIDGILIQNSSGGFYNNLDPNVNNLRIKGYTQDSVAFGSSLSGADHQLADWRKIGGGGSWGQNASANLQMFNMDQRVAVFSNVTNAGGTGTFLANADGVSLPAIGSLYAVSKRNDLAVQFSQPMALDDTYTLISMPAHADVNITIHVLNGAGRFSATYVVANNAISKVVGSQFSDGQFVLELSGDDLLFVSKNASTGTVSASAVYSIFSETNL